VFNFILDSPAECLFTHTGAAAAAAATGTDAAAASRWGSLALILCFSQRVTHTCSRMITGMLMHNIAYIHIQTCV